jgi:hypothetical protein
LKAFVAPLFEVAQRILGVVATNSSNKDNKGGAVPWGKVARFSIYRIATVNRNRFQSSGSHERSNIWCMRDKTLRSIKLNLSQLGASSLLEAVRVTSNCCHVEFASRYSLISLIQFDALSFQWVSQPSHTQVTASRVEFQARRLPASLVSACPEQVLVFCKAPRRFNIYDELSEDFLNVSWKLRRQISIKKWAATRLADDPQQSQKNFFIHFVLADAWELLSFRSHNRKKFTNGYHFSSDRIQSRRMFEVQWKQKGFALH